MIENVERVVYTRLYARNKDQIEAKKKMSIQVPFRDWSNRSP